MEGQEACGDAPVWRGCRGVVVVVDNDGRDWVGEENPLLNEETDIGLAPSFDALVGTKEGGGDGEFVVLARGDTGAELTAMGVWTLEDWVRR